MKPEKSLKAHAVLELIEKQWANVEDIIALGTVGKSKATEIKNNISKELIEEGYMLPRGYIPMDKLVSYFKINISYFKNIVNNEDNIIKEEN